MADLCNITSIATANRLYFCMQVSPSNLIEISSNFNKHGILKYIQFTGYIITKSYRSEERR